MDLKTLSLWSRFTVTLEFTSSCIGGVPNGKNLIEGWLKTKNLATNEVELAALVDATVEQLPGKVEEKASAMWTVFKSDPVLGLYLEGRQVKAMFKESANILRDLLLAKDGGKKAKKNADGDSVRSRFTNLKSRLAERLYVEENIIPFTRNGTPFQKPDGSEERPIHVQTPMGPRTALKRTDYMAAGTRVTFTVRLLDDGVVDIDLVKLLLEHSSMNGLGADRSQGFGTFTVVDVSPIVVAKAA